MIEPNIFETFLTASSICLFIYMAIPPPSYLICNIIIAISFAFVNI
jgi:hypothetical protein